jgi:hypothetical protein
VSTAHALVKNVKCKGYLSFIIGNSQQLALDSSRLDIREAIREA